MDLLRFTDWHGPGVRDHGIDSPFIPSNRDYEGLDTVLQDAHLRRDVARRADLTPFVRDEASGKAA
ncbi:MAG: hypothetical protein J0G94_09390 [Sphingomonadales bacterium]|nr:hypothetical protein [Sphingomonadales bacterium]